MFRPSISEQVSRVNFKGPINGPFKYQILIVIVFLAYQLYDGPKTSLSVVTADGLSMVMAFITLLIFSLCLIYCQTVNKNFEEWGFFLLLTESIILIAFLVKNLFIFFMLFEFSLVPMFILVLKWGSRGRRVHASYYLIMYTLLSSVLLLYALFVWYEAFGTFDFQVLQLRGVRCDPYLQGKIVLLFFAGFAAKIPVFPVHIWLPEAHVEAPTVVSVLLASLVLKLGFYALARISIICPDGIEMVSPVVWIVGIVSMVYAACAALVSIDIKKVLAYSSIVHMNLGLIALFTESELGLLSSFSGMVSHSLSSAAMFFIVGMIYERIGTRNLLHFSLCNYTVLDVLRLYALIVIIINMGLPGTIVFGAEVFQYLTIVSANIFIGLGVILAGFLVSSLFNLHLLYRVSGFSSIKEHIAKEGLISSNIRIEETLVILTLVLVNFLGFLYLDLVIFIYQEHLVGRWY